MKTEKKPYRVMVEFHAGYKGEEEPRLVILDDRRMPVERILARKRVLDSLTGRFHHEFHCFLDGREAKLTISESGEQYVTFET